MNIALMRLKPVVAELRAIRTQLERLAECWEAELLEIGVNMQALKQPVTDKSEPVITYTDEVEDFVREALEHEQRMKGKRIQPETEDGY